jgi:soluble lytic murein transglycosylase-like protein
MMAGMEVWMNPYSIPRVSMPASRLDQVSRELEAISDAFDAVAEQMTQRFEDALRQAMAKPPSADTASVSQEALPAQYGAMGPVWGLRVPNLTGLDAVERTAHAGQPAQNVVVAPSSDDAAQGVARWRSLINEVSAKHGVDAHLLERVVAQESGGNPLARSPAGALGLMQLMPATARELGVVDALDPAQNLAGGARYLKQMLARFNGDLPLAVAAYNAGPSQVSHYGGIPPFAESQQYVARVLGADSEP